MSDNDKYIPIDCGDYSNFELAIMRRWKLRLSWRGDDGLSHLETVFPRDLKTQNREEYLIAETISGDDISIRLDRIHTMEQV